MYILIMGGRVIVGGEVANQSMIDEGYVEYSGTLPQLGLDEVWVWDIDTKTIITKSILTSALVIERAKEALDKSTITVERIQEAVSLGLTTLTTPDVVTFMEYRRALRSIITDASIKVHTSSAPIIEDLPVLPAQPPYPQGT